MKKGLSFFKITLALISAIFIAVGITLINAYSVYGESFSFTPVLSDIQVYNVENPSYAYVDDEVCVILQENNTLICYYDGEYKTKTFTSLQQVHNVNGTVVFNDHNTLSRLNLQDLSVTEIQNETEITLSASGFDINENYLVTVDATSNLIIYEISFDQSGNPTLLTAKKVEGLLDGNKPVCLNKDNLFCVKSGNDAGIYIYDLVTEETQKLSNASPISMVSFGDYLYYLNNNGGLGKINFVNKEENVLVVDAEIYPDYNYYGLGKLKNPSSVSEKDGNLIITNSDSVDEYKINGNSLQYTGFSIAKNKTAFNRVGNDVNNTNNNVVNLRKTDGLTAVLDSVKITLIKNTPNGNEYDNILFSNISYLNGGYTSDFALGNKTVLAVDEINKKVSLIDLKDKQCLYQGQITDNGIITDLCYKNGTYYFIVKDINNVHIYCLQENGNAFTELQGYKATISGGNDPLICVDNYNNIYLANVSSGKLIKLKYYYTEKEYSQSTTEYNYNLPEEIAKIEIDVSGKVFALSTSGTTLYVCSPLNYEETEIQETKSFTLSDYDKKVYFSFANDERLFISENLPNASLSEIPDDSFKIDNTAYGETEIYKTKTGTAFGYEISNANDTVTYNYLGVINVDDLVLVKEYEIGFTTFAILGGRYSEYDANSNTYIKKDVIAVTEKSNCVGVTTEKTVAEKTLFVSTEVSLYALPIITETDYYTLKDTSSLRIAKKTELLSSYSIKVLDTEFYFVTLDLNNLTVCGYVPKKFTVEVLAEDLIKESFEIINVKPCTLFTDYELTTEFMGLDTVTSVKLFDIYNGIAKIGVNTLNGYVTCYVNESDLIITENNALKIGVIVVVASLIITTTSVYLILRKKRNEDN